MGPIASQEGSVPVFLNKGNFYSNLGFTRRGSGPPAPSSGSAHGDKPEYTYVVHYFKEQQMFNLIGGLSHMLFNVKMQYKILIDR